MWSWPAILTLILLITAFCLSQQPVDFHPNKESFLSSSSDGIVNHWFIDQPNLESTSNYPDAVKCAIWNPRDPNLYASTCIEGNLHIRDIRNRNDLISIKADDVPLLSASVGSIGSTPWLSKCKRDLREA